MRAWSSLDSLCMSIVVRYGLASCKPCMVLRSEAMAWTRDCHASETLCLSSWTGLAMTSHGSPCWSRNVVPECQCQAICWRRFRRTLRGPGAKWPATAWVCKCRMISSKCSDPFPTTRYVSNVDIKAKHWGSVWGASTKLKWMGGDVPLLCSPKDFNAPARRLAKCRSDKWTAAMACRQDGHALHLMARSLLWYVGSERARRLHKGAIWHFLATVKLVTKRQNWKCSPKSFSWSLVWNAPSGIGLGFINGNIQKLAKFAHVIHSRRKFGRWTGHDLQIVNVWPAGYTRKTMLAPQVAKEIGCQHGNAA